jgi:hypothetical protein
MKTMMVSSLALSGLSFTKLKDLHEDKDNHFVFYADSPYFPQEGSPKAHHSENFLKISNQIKQMAPSLDFLAFVGDHVWGYTPDKEILRAQWREWIKDFEVMKNYEVYHTTGNHTVYDDMSTSVFKEFFPSIPQNGPIDQKGLYYYVRKKELLMIFVNTAYQNNQKEGRVNFEWVDNVLTENSDAEYKLVFGHHPAHHINGYTISGWRMWDEYAVPFWNVLVKHNVKAYICAHIIAFDVQVHEGVLQITSAGGGFPSMYPPPD